MSGRGGGRGWYYKQKYGGGGRGGGSGSQDVGGIKRERLDEQMQLNDGGAGASSQAFDDDDIVYVPSGSGAVSRSLLPTVRGTVEQLRGQLQNLNGRPYPAYRDLVGSWSTSNGSFVIIDHVQSDPYAPPSRACIRVPHAVAVLPRDLWSSAGVRRVALCDWLTRRFADALARDPGHAGGGSGGAGTGAGGTGGNWHGAKGGVLGIDAPGQYVLERSSCKIDEQGVEIRFTVALPAAGRSIMGQQAAQLLTVLVPNLMAHALHHGAMTPAEALAARRHVEHVEDQAAARAALASHGLVAFVANGAILPRRSGVSELPLAVPPAVPFASPPSMCVTLRVPNAGQVVGMGIKAGVTLIVGGGFHGKSTLLQALHAGVYNKVPGDGRDMVVCDDTAVKIRAEDGRGVTCVDISPFINNLPGGKDTTNFSTENASGSTSQAANIQEAVAAGAKTLLLDEDTCASNFMLRDALMAAFLPGTLEPITPFLTKVRALSASGVSSILVVGGSGEYFRVADAIIAMAHFQPSDATARAKEIVGRFDDAAGASQAPLTPATPVAFPVSAPRHVRRVLPPISDPRGPKVRPRSVHSLQLQDQEVQLVGLESLVEVSQTRAVGYALCWMQRQLGADARPSLQQLSCQLQSELDAHGLEAIAPHPRWGDLVRPRLAEIAAALNRVRTLQIAL